MIQNLRRLCGGISQLDFEGMPLVGADLGSVRVEGEAFLVTGRNDGVELLASDRETMLRARGKKCVDVDPSRLVKSDADLFGFMAQHKAKELTDSDIVGGHD